MFTTGLAMQATGSALPQSAWCVAQQWAQKINAMIGGSVALSTRRRSDRFRWLNRRATSIFMITTPVTHGRDTIIRFRKRREIVEWRGWRNAARSAPCVPVAARNKQIRSGVYGDNGLPDAASLADCHRPRHRNQAYVALEPRGVTTRPSFSGDA